MSDVEADAPPPAQEEESAAAAAAGTETAASEATASGGDASAAAAVAAKAEASSDDDSEDEEDDEDEDDDDSEAEALAAAEAVAAAEAKAKAAADAAAAAKKQTEEAAAAAATASGADSAAAAKAAAAAAAKASGPLASDEDELMRLSTELEAALARVAVLEEQNADLQSKYRKYKDLAKRLHRQRSASVVEAPRRAGRSLSHSDEPGGDKKTPSRSTSKDGPPGAAAALATKEGRSDSITSHDSAASGGSGGKRSGGGGGGGGASASGTGDISDDEEDSASAASGTDSAASGSGSGSGSGKASSSAGGAGGGGGGGGAGGGAGAGDEDEAEELTPDGDHDQVLSEELLTDEGELRNATPSQLVRRLAGVKPIDGNYARDFVVTYSHFSTAAGLLELLERRFEFVAPDGADPKLVKYYDTWRGPVQMRVINILRKLVETNPTEFAGVLDDDDDDDAAGGAAAAGASGASEDMAQVRVMWKRLLAAMGEAGKPDWATRLEETLDHRRRTGLVVAAAEVPLSEMEATALLKKRRESSPVNSFDDLDPLELSRQLTLFEWTLFSKVSPNELRSGNWEKEKTKHLCPGVLGVTNWFNLFSNWIVTDIVGRPDLKPRCKALQRWICVGAHCLSMGNYQAVCEVVAALNRAPVSRLASTWAIVNKALRKSFDHMTELMGGSRNYADYRARMEAAQPPLVPYLGVFTKDLLAIESGNPDFVNEEGEEIPADGDGDDAHQDGDPEAAAAAADDRPQRRVNWTKMRMIAANVHQIQACQGKRFPFKPLDTAQAYLSAHFDGTAGDKGSTIITDDATLHQLSKQCEDGKNSQAHASSSSGDKGTARLFRRTKSTRGTNSGADED